MSMLAEDRFAGRAMTSSWSAPRQTTASTGGALPTPPRTQLRCVALCIDPSRARRHHRELALRLARETGARVILVRGRSPQLPASVDLLLDLERLLHRLRGPRLADRLDGPQLGILELAAEPPDLVIDFCGTATSAHGRVLRIRYDGVADEAALFGALAAGRLPLIEIEDSETGGVLARGQPCADNAGTLFEAHECVLARLSTLLTAAMRGVATPASLRVTALQRARTQDLATFEMKSLAYSIARALYRLCCHAPHWRTCWRFVEGPDLWQKRTLAGTSWNVIPDPGFRFYADPFPFVHEGQAWVFVEDLDHRTNKAVISVVPFDANGPSGPARPVLEEPWHLSYPFVFAHDGEVWMIPESSANRTVSLYRAERFPDRWVREATLLDDIEASDATVVQHSGSFWLFAATRDGVGSWSDTLSIFRAPDIRGPFTPHPGNPVLVDQASARPAGAVVSREGALWRPVQDCTFGYGTGIGLAEIRHLDEERFEQVVHAVLRAPPDWPGRRLHTLNRAGPIECIDGAAHSPRNRQLARLLEGWSGRRGS